MTESTKTMVDIKSCQNCGQGKAIEIDFATEGIAVDRIKDAMWTVKQMWTASSGFSMSIECEKCGYVHYSEVLDWNGFIKMLSGAGEFALEGPFADDVEEEGLVFHYWKSDVNFDKKYSDKMFKQLQHSTVSR